MVAEELVADPVELVGGDAGGDVGADQLAGLRGQPAGDPHLLDRLGVLDLAAGEALGRGLVDVLGTGDLRGHGATGRHGAGGDRCCDRHAASVVSGT